MLPIKNGIANVVELGADGKSTLHPFNCTEHTKAAAEVADYRISEDGRTLRLVRDGETTEFTIVSLVSEVLTLAQAAGDSTTTFTYLRTLEVAPLCMLFAGYVSRPVTGSAYQATDFTGAPTIPPHPDLARYVGRWASDDGVVQIEVRRDADGSARLHHDRDENWTYLFNNVAWVGNELHYRSFAYSEREDLFDHPYHKSSSEDLLVPVADPDRIRWSFFSGGERIDYLLTRVR